MRAGQTSTQSAAAAVQVGLVQAVGIFLLLEQYSRDRGATPSNTEAPYESALNFVLFASICASGFACGVVVAALLQARSRRHQQDTARPLALSSGALFVAACLATFTMAPSATAFAAAIAVGAGCAALDVFEVAVRTVMNLAERTPADTGNGAAALAFYATGFTVAVASFVCIGTAMTWVAAAGVIALTILATGGDAMRN